MTFDVLLPFALAERSIPGWIIQAVLVFLFIGLPILRSIRESAAKKRALDRDRPSREPRSSPASGESADDPPDDMQEARRRFEALLRGEAPDSAPRIPPPRARVAEAPVPEAALAGRLTDMRPAPNEDDTEAGDDPETADPEHFIPDEELRSREEIDRRIRVEREARADFLARERAGSVGRRTSVAAETMTSIGAPTAAATIERAVRPDALFEPDANANDRRAAMRRAFIAAEILGAPTALRDGGTGPASLRSSR